MSVKLLQRVRSESLPYSLEFRNEFLHQTELITVLLPEVLLAGFSGLLLPVFGAEGHGGEALQLGCDWWTAKDPRCRD